MSRAEKIKEALEKRKNGKNRRIIYYLLIAVVSLPILIVSSGYLILWSSYGIVSFVWIYWLIPNFILSLICFVFSIYKSIRERQTEGVSSKDFSINGKKMQNKYYKSIAKVIIGAIIALTAFIWDEMDLAELLFINPILIALPTIPIGIIIWLYGLYGIYLYKFKPEKYKEALEKELSEEIKITDDEIKRNYYKFLVMIIIMPIFVFLFLSPLSFFIFGGLSPFILIIGSIIIFEIYRLYLKKMSGATNRNRGIVGILNGIIILSIGLLWIYFLKFLIPFMAYYLYLFYIIIFILIGLVMILYGIIFIYKSIRERRTKGS